MQDKIVHDTGTDQNQREDLLHTDTVATDGQSIEQPGGYEQSLNPTGEVPAGGAGIDAQGGSIADRVGGDPSNLGDDIPEQGDIVHPAPMNAPIGKMPGM